MFSTDSPFQRPTGAAIEWFSTEFDTDEQRSKFSEDKPRRLFGIAR